MTNYNNLFHSISRHIENFYTGSNTFTYQEIKELREFRKSLVEMGHIPQSVLEAQEFKEAFEVNF